MKNGGILMEQTGKNKAIRNYEKRIGMISKSYKLKSELVENFRIACEKQGLSQSGVLSEYMKEFIKKSEIDKE